MADAICFIAVTFYDYYLCCLSQDATYGKSDEGKNSIRLHRHHHHRRRKRRRCRCRRRLSFDTVVIYNFFSVACTFGLFLCRSLYVWIEIWIENCYHKHIWLGRFLYAWTQFAVNSTTKNIINHFGSFSVFSALFCSCSISILWSAFVCVFFFWASPVFYSISFQSSFYQLVKLWCKRFLFIFSIAFCRCDWRLGRDGMRGKIKSTQFGSAWWLVIFRARKINGENNLVRHVSIQSSSLST